MKPLLLFMNPDEAWNALENAYIGHLNAFCDLLPGEALSYSVGILLAKSLPKVGLDPDFTPPVVLFQALSPARFGIVGSAEWHLLSDDLVYAVHLAHRGLTETHTFLAGEVLRRRRSPIFRSWRRAQRVAEWTRQRALWAFGLLEVA